MQKEGRKKRNSKYHGIRNCTSVYSRLSNQSLKCRKGKEGKVVKEGEQKKAFEGHTENTTKKETRPRAPENAVAYCIVSFHIGRERDLGRARKKGGGRLTPG